MGATRCSSHRKCCDNLKSMPDHILIVAGDPSADRHAASLITALKSKRPGIRISALGGTYLKKSADHFLYPLVGVGGFGFWEPIFKLPQLWSALQKVKQLLEKDPPDLVIPIDYYGFNIRVAKLAQQQGIPVAYYISPQVWASRPGRIKELAAVVKKMLVIFPFEADLYKAAGVPVAFVGHPLLEQIPSPGSPAAAPLMGLLPGSRRGTIQRHLPVLLATALRLHARFPDLRCVLFRPEEIGDDFYKPYVHAHPWIQVTADPLYEQRKSLWLAISVSGTAALENMLLGIPMIIMYKLSALTYRIAKSLIRVRYVGIPNILAGKLVVTERLQDEATPERLADDALDLLSHASKRQAARSSLLSLRSLLQDGGSSRAADEILGMMA